MSKHPHFDDRGTLSWHTRWEDALAAARRDGKLIFIEMGREQCSNCRTLVQGVVPQPSIAKLLQERFVALASDVDDPEPAVLDLAMQNLADATMLPFVLFTDAEGNFLAGGHGAVHPDRFRETLEELAAAG
ncbi:MAG: thioredoxin family protein [Planctomycetota bacterium]